MPHPEREHELQIALATALRERDEARERFASIRETLVARINEHLADQEALAAARRECEGLRKALEPFAKMADGKDSWNEGNGCAVFATMAQVRAARAALAAPADGEEGKR